MAKQTTRHRPAPKPSRPQSGGSSRSRNRYQRRRVSGGTFWVVVAVVVLLGVAAVLATALGGGSSSKTGSTRALAPASLVSKVTGVTDAVSNQVGGGPATLPKAIDAPALTKDGKPLVLYMGAEYCPFCATERWAMVLALSRFGTFTDLGQTSSSTADVYPGTPTFSFHGAKYSSPYIAFDGVELDTNQLNSQGTAYTTLDKPTAAQQALMTKYDAPPYVSSSTPGTIPFIDIGGKYLVSGATYSAALLQGKTADQMAALLTDPTNPTTQGIVGAANSITAAICKVTGNQPTSVCSQPAITALAAQLG